MIDFEAFDAFWDQLIGFEMPSASEEVFLSKLSKLGVKAPFGTPPAEQQLAHAIAKAKVGSGTFMGEPIDGSEKLEQARLMVDYNMSLEDATKVAAAK